MLHVLQGFCFLIYSPWVPLKISIESKATCYIFHLFDLQMSVLNHLYRLINMLSFLFSSERFALTQVQFLKVCVRTSPDHKAMVSFSLPTVERTSSFTSQSEWWWWWQKQLKIKINCAALDKNMQSNTKRQHSCAAFSQAFCFCQVVTFAKICKQLHWIGSKCSSAVNKHGMIIL